MGGGEGLAATCQRLALAVAVSWFRLNTNRAAERPSPAERLRRRVIVRSVCCDAASEITLEKQPDFSASSMVQNRETCFFKTKTSNFSRDNPKLSAPWP
jgi:hypothetical protein